MIGTDPSTVISLSGIEQDILYLVGTVLLALASWAAQRLVKFLNLKNGDAIAANLTDAARKGIKFGTMQSLDVIKAKGWDHVDTHNAIGNAAVQFITDKFPGYLKDAGIDPATPEGAKKLADLVTRSLPDGIAEAAASPATPPTNTGIGAAQP